MGHKRSKERRSHLKRFASDYINVLSAPNPDALSAYQSRVSTTRGRRDQVEPILNHTWTKPLPQTWSKEGQHTERKAVIERMHRLRGVSADPIGVIKGQLRDQAVHSTSNTYIGVDEFHYRVIFAREGWVIKEFFSGNKFVFVQERYGISKISTVYNGRDAANRAYDSQNILWLHVLKPSS